MNISMHRTAKSLELVKVEVYNCSILCPYLFLHKTLIIQTKCHLFLCILDYILYYSTQTFKFLEIKMQLLK